MPKQPTEEMGDAGEDGWRSKDDHYSQRDSAVAAYKEMLRVAPEFQGDLPANNNLHALLRRCYESLSVPGTDLGPLIMELREVVAPEDV